MVFGPVTDEFVIRTAKNWTPNEFQCAMHSNSSTEIFKISKREYLNFQNVFSFSGNPAISKSCAKRVDYWEAFLKKKMFQKLLLMHLQIGYFSRN